MALFKQKKRVLFVCTENICRSPLAEALMRQHLKSAGLDKQVGVDSVGTKTSQPGFSPDRRAQSIAVAAGVSLGRIRSRRVRDKDLAQSDWIMAMDHANMRDLKRICPAEHMHKVSLLLSHSPDCDLEEVPDPYYDSYEAFERVFHIIEHGVISLIPMFATCKK